MTETESLLREIPKGLLKWYPFRREEKILYIGTGVDACYELLAEQNQDVVCCAMEQSVQPTWCREHSACFDRIISIAGLEMVENPVEVLAGWKRLLMPQGCLLLGMNNRFGIRYFCGDRDPYTGRNFDGIENYRRYAVKKEDVLTGRAYNKAELEDFLDVAGWKNRKFYSVFPNLEQPSFIFAEDFLPNEELNTRCFPMYHSPDTVFLEEEFLYSDLIKNDMFHKMANAYLIECHVDERTECSDIEHVTISLDRGKEDALFTMIHSSGIVEKRAAYEEGKPRLRALVEHAEDLKKHGICVLDARLDGNSYQMPFIKAETALAYLRRCAHTDRDLFIAQMDRFRDIILQSSEQVEQEKNGEKTDCLKKGYLDLVPLNCFVTDETFMFYDQEFCVEDCPIGVLVARLVDLVYVGDYELERILPKTFFLKRYGIADRIDDWRRMSVEFLTKLRKEKELRVYHERFRRNSDVVNTNRQRMNFSDAEYQKLFIDLFKGVEDKNIVLFGSGAYAQKFLALYGEDYPVYAVVDNNELRFGQEINGVPIQSPQLLSQLKKGEYKVIVCIKSYLSVINQLVHMGITDYGIYDPNRSYPRKKRAAEVQTVTVKKYHTGYIAGVFDLFHVGHLNLLKRAKEQCEYLIVGVVTDEGAVKFKKKEPVIPFRERIEIVRSCRYVDEAVEIPLNYGGTRDAYRMYHFDCQFSGSDYLDDPNWLAEKEFLEKQGADLVFFPYTKETSSTQIRSLIQKELS